MSTSSGAATNPTIDRRCSKNASGSENAETSIHAPTAKKQTDSKRRRCGVAHTAFTHAGPVLLICAGPRRQGARSSC